MDGTWSVKDKVGIGIVTPQHELDVNGVIRAKEIRVNSSGWADYVFDDGYELLSLPRLEAYIRQNRRLPGLPSAEDLDQQGITLSQMLALQMEKIEELSLYLIQLRKQKEREFEELRSQIDYLETIAGCNQ